jgi:hypothetical protein
MAVSPDSLPMKTLEDCARRPLKAATVEETCKLTEYYIQASVPAKVPARMILTIQRLTSLFHRCRFQRLAIEHGNWVGGMTLEGNSIKYRSKVPARMILTIQRQD